MRPVDLARAGALEKTLIDLHAELRPLPGIEDVARRKVLVEQIVDSLRRVEFAHFVRDEKFDATRADPSSSAFDPLRAAVYWARKRDLDEAMWLVFLFVHFGKHPSDGYRLVRDVYGALGGKRWNWPAVSSNPKAFHAWLGVNEKQLRGGDGVSRRFGNHRKYESLSASSPAGTAAVIDSYIAWVAPPRTHYLLIQDAHKQVGQNPRTAFDYLYKSMNIVFRFGRLAKFDYLTMLGKLGLAPIEPGSAYLGGATGPLAGARLLFAAYPSGEDRGWSEGVGELVGARVLRPRD
jgi:hypothetical protein